MMMTIQAIDPISGAAYIPRSFAEPELPESPDVFDLCAALPTFSGSLPAVVRAASILVENSPHFMSAMYACVLRGDADGLRRMAHILYLASDRLCAARVRELAYSIEHACLFSDPSLLRSAVEQCAAEVAFLRAALRRVATEQRH
jgi:hypothetical protein